MIFGDSKGFLGLLRDFLDFQGSLGFLLDSQGSSDFFSRFFGMVYEIFASDTPLAINVIQFLLNYKFAENSTEN